MACCKLPDWLSFKDKVSFVLWAEFNLVFLVLWLRDGFDLANALWVVSLTGLIVIKLRQFVDGRVATQEEPYDYLDSQKHQECVADWVAAANRGIHFLVRMSTFTDLAKFLGGVWVTSLVIDTFCLCTLTWLGGNGLFAYAYALNAHGINVCDLVKAQYDVAKQHASTFSVPKYSDPKKNI